MDHPQPLFNLFMVFFKQILQKTNVKKMFIQYTVQGFEPITSFHNH